MRRIAAIIVLLSAVTARDVLSAKAVITLSGKPQEVTLYPARGATAVVVLSSGDLGWAGFVVDVAEFLQSQGVAVLGFNTRQYLESFTGETSALEVSQVSKDYAVLAGEARRLLGVSTSPALIGISEGAGLSVIAATAEPVQTQLSGVICLGLPETVELGWRTWRDWTIWITKGSPREPEVNLRRYVSEVAPLPLVVVQSTRDEFVPLETARSLFAVASEPKRLFLIDATNHRFSDKRDELHARIIEALAWFHHRDP